MTETIAFLSHHGAMVVFAFALIDQIGVPIPVFPWLLAAGSLSASGKANWWLILSAGTCASLISNAIWFYLGRIYGIRVLGFLCRITIEPDHCITRMQNVYTRFGMMGLIVSKFMPGLNTLAPALAGNSGISTLKFIAVDGLSAVLFCGVYILLGFIFSQQLDMLIQSMAKLGGGALGIIGGIIAVYLVIKYVRRQLFLRKLRMARITADELFQLQEDGNEILVLDLRSHSELAQDPSLIRGAIHMNVDEVEKRHLEIPRDRDIILYCSCPNEVTSARIAFSLHRKGIERVRPLLGGIDAWRQRKYPTDRRKQAIPNIPSAVLP
jgi:membrane protein DedA with SNARE-associated domain/rhodanese-related sulfurtransferase